MDRWLLVVTLLAPSATALANADDYAVADSFLALGAPAVASFSGVDAHGKACSFQIEKSSDQLKFMPPGLTVSKTDTSDSRPQTYVQGDTLTVSLWEQLADSPMHHFVTSVDVKHGADGRIASYRAYEADVYDFSVHVYLDLECTLSDR